MTFTVGAGCIIATGGTAAWAYQVAVCLFFMAFFVPSLYYAFLGAREERRERELGHVRRQHEMEKLKYQMRLYKGGINPDAQAQAGPTVDNDVERQRISRCKEFWLDFLSWSAEHGGVIAFNVKNGTGASEVMSYEDWRAWVIGPFIRHNPPWVVPVYQGGKTQWANGVTVWAVLACIQKGDLPPIPPDEPPQLSTVETRETPSNSHENSGRGFEQSKVFAKDIRP